MGNLPAIFPNATPLVRKKFSIAAKCTAASCNCKQQLAHISDKMGFTVEDKALIINN
jgi:hypothetical protein